MAGESTQAISSSLFHRSTTGASAISTETSSSSESSKPASVHRHLYHGHRRASFTTTDVEELTELRARQRTFEGAYQRTALGMAVYAIIVLKIFSPAFAKIGILYVVMAALLIIVSILRRRRSLHDFADIHRPPVAPLDSETAEQPKKPAKRVWGREFRTVGNLVIFLTCAVASLELAIFVQLMKM